MSSGTGSSSSVSWGPPPAICTGLYRRKTLGPAQSEVLLDTLRVFFRATEAFGSLERGERVDGHGVAGPERRASSGSVRHVRRASPRAGRHPEDRARRVPVMRLYRICRGRPSRGIITGSGSATFAAAAGTKPASPCSTSRRRPVSRCWRWRTTCRRPVSCRPAIGWASTRVAGEPVHRSLVHRGSAGRLGAVSVPPVHAADGLGLVDAGGARRCSCCRAPPCPADSTISSWPRPPGSTRRRSA